MYIKTMDKENKYISYWLLLITFLVGLMIVVGGLTRLTDSGLSITTWSLFSGILPPLSINDWENLFNLYKQIPEYKLLNSSMTIDEFKFIFWWEYIHRLLGRVIGLFYLVPLIFFSYKNLIKKDQKLSLYSIFILILIQGFVGWYMVQSGLVERTDVSHYRLSMHLTLAFIIYILLFWNFLKHNNNYDYKDYKKIPYKLPLIFTVIIVFQISIGALVSGQDACQVYQTWPMMGQSFFPDDSSVGELLSFKSLDNPSLVQFIHRNIAYLIFILYLFILYLVFKNKEFIYLRNTTLLIFIFLMLQIFLGIITILSGAQIILASLHQIGSIFLVSASIVLLFKNYKTS